MKKKNNKRKEPTIVIVDHFKSKTEEERIENIKKIFIKYLNKEI